MAYLKQCPRTLEANGFSEEGQMEHDGMSYQIGHTYIDQVHWAAMPLNSSTAR